MSTTIYDSPDDAQPSVPHQGKLSIDITIGTVWFFEHRANDLVAVTVPLGQLTAIYRAIGSYLGDDAA